MCGIAGIYAYHYAANPADRDELVRIRDHMVARGPDGAGVWHSGDGRIALGHRRLSIIDLSAAGAQPMANSDGRFVVTFNGEIYNHRELRKGLEADGCQFRSQSDTEVLLHLYLNKGAAMVRHLRGMFAFAIWDTLESKLFLARDPYGIKPLYYTDDGWTFRFASQVKALLAGGRISRDPEPAGLVGFYLFGSVPEPYTTHLSIRALPAGCTMTVDAIGAHRVDRYHSVSATYASAEAAPSVSREDALPMAAEALLDSVRHHLVADVPVGAFLSAGIDSGALVGLMRDAGARDIETVTLAFAEFEGRNEDEAPLAAEVARRYGTRHTTRRIAESEFVHDLPLILEAMDQPTIDGINTWFVSKAARELGLKVAISGLGGDELLGGYPSFRTIPQAVNALRWPARVPLAGTLLRSVLSMPGVRDLLPNPKHTGLLQLGGTYPGAWLLQRGLFLPWELEAVLDPGIVRDGVRRLSPLEHVSSVLCPEPRSSFARIATLESSLYMRNQLLRDADWAGMAHSIEIRVPLVDSTLLERIAPVSVCAAETFGKRLLAAAPSTPLPDSVASRRKTGFVTPVGVWLERNRISRLRPYTSVERLAAPRCPWARRWAYSVAAAA